ncbi:SMP-30/gluconolactonase/LRE family protein [Geopsychrobacter electrodiphilus]|uniref:SMP-30/gluconolactonase/LRE family protein n=1 Tax=Geopsychrobacter electrodiphilus TaxID=225196 RepID=UPI000475AC98|nr:SMP-30/gluconolactonase/LRE family protein [Geopsychrobacter electrodiphilus]
MYNKYQIRSWWFLIVILLLLPSCAPGIRSLSLSDPDVNVVWPKPPAQPRIRLLRRFSGTEDLVEKKSQKSILFQWLTGEGTESLQMGTPYGVASDGKGLLWVTDPGNHLVFRFDLAGRRTDLLTNIAGEPFQTPSGIVFDPDRDRLYVADSGLRRVYIFSSKGEFQGQVGSDEIFLRPAGLAIDRSGNLLVADVLQGLVLRFSPQGQMLSSFRSSVTADGLFNRPLSIAVDRSGRVYVVDSLNFRVEVLDDKGHGIGTIGGLGDVPGTFSRPRGVAVDSVGHIYVTDAAFDNIQIFGPDGRLLLVFGSGGKWGLSLPSSLFIDQRDRIYAVDTYNHQVQIYQYLSPGQDK